jgi:hypothetical protein
LPQPSAEVSEAKQTKVVEKLYVEPLLSQHAGERGVPLLTRSHIYIGSRWKQREVILHQRCDLEYTCTTRIIYFGPKARTTL